MEIKYLLPINWQNSQTWLLFCHWRTFLVNLTRSINARCKAFAVSLVNPFTHWPWELESICLNFSVISSKKSNLASSIASFKSFAMSIDFMFNMFHIRITNLMNLSVSSISCFPSHYVKSVCILSFTGPYSVWMQENTDQKNSEYGHFSRNVYWSNWFLVENIYY